VTQSAPVLHTATSLFCAALELSLKRWKLGFTNGDRFREVTVDAGNFEHLVLEVAKARRKLQVSDDVPLRTCYEAGRDGFWIHRRLVELGIDNIIVDPSSIQVNRRARRAKTDHLDVMSLTNMLVRYVRGERNVWQVVHVPSVVDEDARRLHRERERLTKEKTAHQTRVRALLALHGLRVQRLTSLQQVLDKVPEHLRAEIEREEERRKLVLEHLRRLDESREAAVAHAKLPAAGKIRDLEQLKGIGPRAATLLTGEFFGWRRFANGKQVGSCAGLTPTPYSSGDSNREQGISKAGSGRLRAMCIEIAWTWVRYQPESKLTVWFNSRFAKGSGRSRRLGIVAVARKLLIALWQYTEHGVIPEGAVMKA
jgi:transposase